MLKIQLLGHFQAERDAQEMPGIRLNGAYRLLALMALQADRAARNTWVAESLWPGSGSLYSLRKAIQTLREALGPEEAGRLRAENNFLRLDLAETDFDVAAFHACVSRGDYRSAIDLYTGPLLHGWEDPWVPPARKGLDQRYRTAIANLAAASADVGQFAQAARIFSQGLSHYPLDEDWWAQLIAAQLKSGARLDALASAQRYQAVLNQLEQQRGIRVPPAPVLKELMRQLQATAEPIPSEQRPDLTVYEAVGGPTPLGSRFYVERPADQETHFAIGQREGIVLIKGARQTGKSSLLVRALHRARKEGAVVLRTPWLQLQGEDLEDAAAFFRAQAHAFADQLQLPQATAAALNAVRTPSVGFTRFLLDHVFTAVKAPILWIIDDADRLFACPFRDDVFALFRAWYNERAYDEDAPWHRFTLALAYAAEAHLAIRNLNQSPFNVGARVTLKDFTPTQLCELNARYGTPLDAAGMDRLYDLVGGHPYLVRRALQEAATRGAALDEIIACAERDGGIFADHLNRMLNELRADADLCTDLRDILTGGPATEESSARLRAAGLLLVTEPSGALHPRCRLYDLFLRRRLL